VVLRAQRPAPGPLEIEDLPMAAPCEVEVFGAVVVAFVAVDSCPPPRHVASACASRIAPGDQAGALGRSQERNRGQYAGAFDIAATHRSGATRRRIRANARTREVKNYRRRGHPGLTAIASTPSLSWRRKLGTG
jgi:hypothetical protein